MSPFFVSFDVQKRENPDLPGKGILFFYVNRNALKHSAKPFEG